LLREAGGVDGFEAGKEPLALIEVVVYGLL